LKKRTKKLLSARPRPGLTNQLPPGVEREAKVFCFFFSKKKYFLASQATLVFNPRPA
jgi:hypothetical protein